jgi:hypothetical protein
VISITRDVIRQAAGLPCQRPRWNFIGLGSGRVAQSESGIQLGKFRIQLMPNGPFLVRLGKFPNDFKTKIGPLISGSTVRARVRPPSKSQGHHTIAYGAGGLSNHIATTARGNQKQTSPGQRRKNNGLGSKYGLASASSPWADAAISALPERSNSCRPTARARQETVDTPQNPAQPLFILAETRQPGFQVIQNVDTTAGQCIHGLPGVRSRNPEGGCGYQNRIPVHHSDRRGDCLRDRRYVRRRYGGADHRCRVGCRLTKSQLLHRAATPRGCRGQAASEDRSSGLVEVFSIRSIHPFSKFTIGGFRPRRRCTI